MPAATAPNRPPSARSALGEHLRSTGGLAALLGVVFVLILLTGGVSSQWRFATIPIILAEATLRARPTWRWFFAVTIGFTPVVHAVGSPDPDAVGFSLVGLATIGICGEFINRVTSELRRVRGELAEQTFQVTSSQAALDHLDSPVIITDPSDHSCIYVNEAAAALLGLSPADLIGQPIDLRSDVRSVAADQGVTADVALEAHGAPVSRPLTLPSPDGDGVVQLAISMKTVVSSGRQLIVAVGHDVTDYQRLVTAQQDAMLRLQEVDRIKNSFLSAVSHELRTPLTVVRGMSATLARHASTLRPEQVSELAHRVDQQARRLDTLLSDLLDVDRLARGTITARREDVEVRHAVAAAVADHPGATVDVRADRGRVDPTQFERILVNLLSNAQKYAGGADLVTVEGTEDGGLHLVVADRGPGVADEDKEQAFEAFVRLDDDHPSPGTGVGLSMVAQFAALHDGRAWLADREGGGIEAHVLLPGGEKSPAPASAQTGSRSRR